MNIMRYRNSIIFAISLIGFYILFFFLNKQNFYVQDGATIINQGKERALENGDISFAEGKTKIMYIGNSKILSGFVPSLFDSLSGNSTYSINYAMGGQDLENVFYQLAKTETKPDVLVLQRPWVKDISASLENQEKLLTMDKLIPFRNYIRNVFLFLGRAKTNGYSFQEFYDISKQSSEDMIANRGYYFIASQALYPDAKLPADYQLAGDDTSKFEPHVIQTEGPIFEKINNWATENKVHVLIGMDFMRRLEAPIGQKSFIANRAVLEEYPYLHVLESAPYVRMENEYFSDPVHLNPTGARLFTRSLHESIGATIQTIAQQ